MDSSSVWKTRNGIGFKNEAFLLRKAKAFFCTSLVEDQVVFCGWSHDPSSIYRLGEH